MGLAARTGCETAAQVQADREAPGPDGVHRGGETAGTVHPFQCAEAARAPNGVRLKNDPLTEVNVDSTSDCHSGVWEGGSEPRHRTARNAASAGEKPPG
jgi:hypothetical protein